MTSAMSKTCGFVGLGIMGEGMANCLLKSGVKLVVWNRSPGKAEALRAAHPEAVTVVGSPAAVVGACEVTFCMLSTPDACKSVYEMAGGLLEGITAGKSVVDCATLAVTDMQRLSEQVIAKGGRFLEAPVSGSKGPAAAGALIFLCGGDRPLFDTVGAELGAMGKKSFFFGEVGAGTKMKLAVNMVMGTMMCALGEGLELCSKQGLEPEKLLEVLELGAVANPMFTLKGPKMLRGDHAPNFPLQHAHKDMHLAVTAGEALGAALPLSATAEGAMKRACEEGRGELDFSAVYESQKRLKP
eukprot:CAMPEP_0119063336 /NCGR_PEP_ID=MMETSP1178-20130426/6709_1 /TAXON_ID=33656 /ORGANISM="unid sp, Strain CCMP2000" /LENGTH=298 /DNA_ID=CAMNT_0007044701 /DNA_START=20 /DNA_END=916 /DNA_ORIENTATION=+